jgi:hypothetical protein
MCGEEGVQVTEMTGGSRRRQISKIRKRIVQERIERYGSFSFQMGKYSEKLSVAKKDMADIPQRLYKAMKCHLFGLHGHTSPGVWSCSQAWNVASDTSRYRR